jgi:hypothetical protein
MAFIGKHLSAVLFRQSGDLATGVNGGDPEVFYHRLYWTDIDWGRPDQIAAYYPDLVWDAATRVGIQHVYNFGPGQLNSTFLTNSGYADVEAAILDQQNYIENVAIMCAMSPILDYRIQFKDGVWIPVGSSDYLNGPMCGDPDTIWAQFPLAHHGPDLVWFVRQRHDPAPGGLLDSGLGQLSRVGTYSHPLHRDTARRHGAHHG